MNNILKYSHLHKLYKKNSQFVKYVHPYVKPCSRYTSPEITHITLCNGVKVATSRSNQPLAMITITCQAGSKFEKHDELGVTHFLRNAMSLTGHMSAFHRMRQLQQTGTYFTVTGGKEFIFYTLIGMKSKIEVACRYLVDAIFKNEFRHCELDDLRSQILLELDTIDPRSQVMDMLHRAAFKRGLGNSIYCPRHKVSEIDGETLRNYIAKNYTNDRCFISTVGMEEGLASYIGESLNLEKGGCGPVPRPSAFLGGNEALRRGGGRRTIAALAVRGGGGGRELTAQAALAFGTRSTLRCQLSMLGAEADFFNVNYDDIGLFGVFLEADGHNMARVCTRAAEYLKTDLAKINVAQAKRAKKALASNIMQSVESSEQALREMALQMARGIQVHSIGDLAQNALALNESDIIDTAVSLSKNALEMTIAAVGDVHYIPSIHELCST